MADGIVEAIQEFSSALCRLGADGCLSIEAPKRMFLNLLLEAVRNGLPPATGKTMRYPVCRYGGPAPFSSHGAPVMASSRTDSVDLDVATIVDGLKIHLHYGAWTVRMNQADRDAMLDALEAIRG